MDFPLHVGDRWLYTVTPQSIFESRVVCDTIMQNGLNYSMVEGKCFSGLFRNDGTKTFSYDTVRCTEFLAYDFSSKFLYYRTTKGRPPCYTKLNPDIQCKNYFCYIDV